MPESAASAAAPIYSIQQWMQDAAWYRENIRGSDIGLARYLKMEGYFIGRYGAPLEVDFRFSRFWLALQFLQKHVHSFAARGIAFAHDGKQATFPKPVMAALWTVFGNRGTIYLLESQPPELDDILAAAEDIPEGVDSDPRWPFDDRGNRVKQVDPQAL